MKPRPIGIATLALCCALLQAACGGGGGELTVRVTRGGAPLANTEVDVRAENPPGGFLKRTTDAEGRLRLPAEYAGLRILVGTDCDPRGTCKGFSKPRRLEGGDITIEAAEGN